MENEQKPAPATQMTGPKDHAKDCEQRYHSCTCGYEAHLEKIAAEAQWSARGSFPEGFTRKEIEDMLSVVQDEPQTIDGGGEFGPQESTDGWYTRLLRTILKNSEGSR